MELTYFQDMYSATFYSITNEYKWKYQYTDEDIAGFLNESFALMIIQFCLTALILVEQESKDVKPNLADYAKFEI